MINKLVELEQARLKAMGFESIVTPVGLYVDKSLVNMTIGNDTYILSGIRLSDTDVRANRHNVCISSATDGLEASQQDIATMGQSIHKLFKNFIIVKTNDTTEWAVDQDVPTFTLDFIKITPLKGA